MTRLHGLVLRQPWLVFGAPLVLDMRWGMDDPLLVIGADRLSIEALAYLRTWRAEKSSLLNTTDPW